MNEHFSQSHFRTWLTPGQFRQVLVMGVLNVTPDSFSDGGKHATVDSGVNAAVGMIQEGASLVDVGGESTRPGSLPVNTHEQMRRVVPVIRGIAARVPGVVISIDTTRADVADAAIDAGASLVNDTSGGTDDPAMLRLVARRRVPIVLMHRRGTPLTMQADPFYDDVTRQVTTDLMLLRDSALAAGIEPVNILLDVGIGFGKTTAHNLQLLRDHLTFASLGHPLLLGASRKRFIGELTDTPDPADRLPGSIAAALWGVDHGAAVLRVHDVAATVRAVRMHNAIATG